jgi:hypothetical protein
MTNLSALHHSADPLSLLSSNASPDALTLDKSAEDEIMEQMAREQRSLKQERREDHAELKGKGLLNLGARVEEDEPAPKRQRLSTQAGDTSTTSPPRTGAYMNLQSNGHPSSPQPIAFGLVKDEPNPPAAPLDREMEEITAVKNEEAGAGAKMEQQTEAQTTIQQVV